MVSKDIFAIGESGLNLPIEWFEKYGLGQGDEVTIIETEQGLVILPRVTGALTALHEIGTALQAKGVTLDELMERGRDIRDDILREKYGIDPDNPNLDD